jgi:hypothetical protein
MTVMAVGCCLYILSKKLHKETEIPMGDQLLAAREERN